MLVGWVIEIWKSQASFGVGQSSRASQRVGYCIAPLIMPKRKVIGLDSANAQQDSQDLATGCLEGQYGIEARASLFNKRKVKSRRVGDRLSAERLGIRDRWLEKV